MHIAGVRVKEGHDAMNDLAGWAALGLLGVAIGGKREKEGQRGQVAHQGAVREMRGSPREDEP